MPEPAGARTRTRIRPTPAEEAALTAIGSHLGSLYRTDLAQRLAQGRLDAQGQAASRQRRKHALTAESSSRWAGAITRAAEDQYQLGLRALTDEVAFLSRATATIDARAAVDCGTRQGKTAGYRDRSERFQKTRRRAHLAGRLQDARDRLTVGRPRIVAGGGKLFRARTRLEAAGMSEPQWRKAWDAARWFLTADGETGKKWGNETIRVTADGTLEVKVPAPLVPTFGTRLVLAAPVPLDTHRGAEWADRIHAHRAVRYDITYDPDKGRWYLDASWAYATGMDRAAAEQAVFASLKAHKTLGIDLNADHLAGYVIDLSGNPVGAPLTVPLQTSGLPASTRDARIREAISALVRHARATGCRSISIENLNFADARAAGRETMGRGRRGKTFRRTVAGIPTARFRDRLAGMAATAGLRVIAVDPAYTSRWGDQHWSKPLQQTSGTTVTRHHAAAVGIGRRALGHRIKRKPTGPRHPQRTMPGHPVGQPTPDPKAATGNPPSRRPAPSRTGPSTNRAAGAPNTVREATEPPRLTQVGTVRFCT